MMVVKRQCIREGVRFWCQIQLAVGRLWFGWVRGLFGSQLGASCEQTCILGCRKCRNAISGRLSGRKLLGMLVPNSGAISRRSCVCDCAS